MKQIREIKQTKNWARALILFTVFSSHAGSNYQMNKYVLGSGSEVKSAAYVMNSSIGQNITTRSNSSSYQMTAGFFQENRDLIFINEFESN